MSSSPKTGLRRSPPSDRDHGASPRERTAERDAAVRRVLWGVLVVNLLVATSKLALGTLVGALALVADGVHSLLDASSNVVGLVGIAAASRPPDESHPYGHRRFETIAALVIGVLIAGGIVEIGQRVVNAIVTDQSPPEVSWPLAAFVALTVVVNLIVSRWEKRRGDALRSALLRADAGHTFSDALAAIAVLASFGATAIGVPWADVGTAALVCLIIARTAWKVLAQNLEVLTDHARVDPRAVHEVATAIDGVVGAHLVRSRGSLDWIHVDLHIQVQAQVSVARAHALSHEVSDAIRERFPEVRDVVVHVEPADGHQHDVAISPSRDTV